MGEGLFIEPASCNTYQLVFLTCVYGYFLFKGSSMISDGSELLLLVPSIAGIVGSIVLPVLGAVPDSLMVLFSGLSDNPQATVAVGVGALAGSTIMLLTVPWCLSVIGGQVPIDHKGNAIYGLVPPATSSLEPRRGVTNSELVKRNGIFMISSALLYLVIQVPVLLGQEESVIASAAGIGCVLCTLCFVWYIVQQYRNQTPMVEDIVTEARVSAIRTGELSLLGAMKELLKPGGKSPDNSLLGTRDRAEMKATVAPFYKQYETLSIDKRIGKDELMVLLRDLQLGRLTESEINALFSSADLDRSGHIDLDEFVNLMISLVRDFEFLVDTDRYYGSEITDDDVHEEEEEDVPHDLVHLTPEQQQAKIKSRAFWLMFGGTMFVLIFSDPAVEVMSEIANRVSISPFYVSFVLAPLASNASEVIASYQYAKRKTKKSIQVALTTLEGAACLNNTFCLSIFLAIVAIRQLEWNFSAEVVSILFVQFALGFMVLTRKVYTISDGLVILALYPASLVLVALLKQISPSG